MRIEEVPARKGIGEKAGSLKKNKNKNKQKARTTTQGKIKSKHPPRKTKTNTNQPKHTSTLSALLKYTFFHMQIFLFHCFIDSE